MKKYRYFTRGVSLLALSALLCAAFASCRTVTTDRMPGGSPSPVSETANRTASPEETESETPEEQDPDLCSHENTKKIGDLEPTCTVEGYKDRLECVDCGAVLDQTGEILPALGHKFEGRKCRYCGKNEPSLMFEGVFEGSEVTYRMYDDGELALSGSGPTPSMSENENGFFFRYSRFVKSIVVYNGVTSIGDSLLRGLKDVTEISIASSVKRIGDRAFDGWSLKTLYLPQKIEYIGKNNFTYNQIYYVELPGSLRHVGAGSFTSSTTVALRIPTSVREYEVAPEGQYTEFTNIAYMGSRERFEKLDLGKYLASDGECATVDLYFEYTGKASDLPYCVKRGKTEGDFTYCCFTDDTARITAYNGSDTEIEIPGKIGKYTVTGIEHNCFEENSKIEKVTLPASCVNIYKEAFLKSSLKELVVKADKLRLGAGAFEDCKSFDTLVFDGVFTDIGARALANTAFANIRLSPDIKVARASAFAHSAITDVDFSQFEVIGDSAFGYTNLGDSLDLSGVREIGMGAFYRTGIKALNVTGVEIIRRGAFASNSSLSLSSVTGLDTVETVEDGAFDFKV